MPFIETPTPIRLLLVDDHTVVRSGLKAFFEDYADLDVIGEAANACDALIQTERLLPDVVLMDLRIPGGGGIYACREIRTQHSQTRVLFLSAFGDEESVFSALLAGAQGYVLKEASSEELVHTIRTIANGHSMMDQMVAKRITEWLRGAKDSHLPDPMQLEKLLTTQEMRILPLVAEGKTNKEIAIKLNLSHKTIKNYLANIFEKLQISRRTQVASLYSKITDVPK